MAIEGDPIVTCSFCAGIAADDCHRCHGSRRLPLDWNMMANIWDVPGCPCAVCRAVRAMRPTDRIQDPVPVAFQSQPPPPHVPTRVCYYCQKRSRQMDMIRDTDGSHWHRPCLDEWNAVQQQKASIR